MFLIWWYLSHCVCCLLFKSRYMLRSLSINGSQTYPKSTLRVLRALHSLDEGGGSSGVIDLETAIRFHLKEMNYWCFFGLSAPSSLKKLYSFLALCFTCKSMKIGSTNRNSRFPGLVFETFQPFLWVILATWGHFDFLAIKYKNFNHPRIALISNKISYNKHYSQEPMTPIVGLLADNKRRWRVRQLVLHIGLIFKIFPLDIWEFKAMTTATARTRPSKKWTYILHSIFAIVRDLFSTPIGLKTCLC